MKRTNRSKYLRVADDLVQVLSTALLQGRSAAMRKVSCAIASRVSRVPSANEILPCIQRIGGTGNFNTFVDVGANMGEITLSVCKLFPRCIAVEPDPMSASVIQEEISYRGFVNSQVAVRALGDTIGKARMFVNKRSDQNSLVQQPHLFPGMSVSVVTLDWLVTEFQLQPPFLIKIDVQGSELRVLMGAKKTLGQDCTIVTEFWPGGLKNSGIQALDLIRFMFEQGFVCLNLSGQPVDYSRIYYYCKLAEKWHKLSTDLMFVRPGKE